jgi:hypothetical protein
MPTCSVLYCRNHEMIKSPIMNHNIVPQWAGLSQLREWHHSERTVLLPLWHPATKHGSTFSVFISYLVFLSQPCVNIYLTENRYYIPSFLLFLYVCCPLILRHLHDSVLMFCFRIPNSSRKRHIHSQADTSLMDCFLCNLNTFIYCRDREAYNVEYECGYECGRVSVLEFWSIYGTG